MSGVILAIDLMDGQMEGVPQATGGDCLPITIVQPMNMYSPSIGGGCDVFRLSFILDRVFPVYWGCLLKRYCF